MDHVVCLSGEINSQTFIIWSSWNWIIFSLFSLVIGSKFESDLVDAFFVCKHQNINSSFPTCFNKNWTLSFAPGHSLAWSHPNERSVLLECNTSFSVECNFISVADEKRSAWMPGPIQTDSFDWTQKSNSFWNFYNFFHCMHLIEINVRNFKFHITAPLVVIFVFVLKKIILDPWFLKKYHRMKSELSQQQVSIGRDCSPDCPQRWLGPS